jgi:hypothetical protein
MMTARGGEYRFVVGSDVQRDGMYPEMTDVEGAFVAEVFYSDVTHRMVVTLDRPSLPIEVVERLLSVAKLRLPPAERGEAAPGS